MTSPAPLTEAEKAAVEVLAARHNATDATHSYSSAAFHGDARAVVAAVQPVFAAEFYEAMAESTDNCGPMSAEGFRGLAIMARLSLSLPVSKETQQ